MNFTVAKLQAMGKDFKSRKLKSLNKNLPGLGDKKAPIIVYADSTFSKEALRGYKELLSWGYKNVTILDGGLTEWKQKGFRSRGMTILSPEEFFSEVTRIICCTM